MLGYSDAGFRELTTNKKVTKLEDLQGQKIRVMTNKYHIAYWNSLGAAATPMQFTEVFMGLQQGTIDGEENPYMNIVGEQCAGSAEVCGGKPTMWGTSLPSL